MPEFLQSFIEFVRTADLATLLSDYGYYAILLLTFLEGETIVILAGIAAAQGLLNPWLIALCAFCGSCSSDQLMFSLGKYKGQAMLDRFPKLKKNVTKASYLILKYDKILILGFRFIYGVRNVTPILLGISGTAHSKFLFLNIIGAGVWALTFAFGGYYAGQAFTHVLHKFGVAIFIGLGALLVIGLGFLYIRRARRSKEPLCTDDCVPEKIREAQQNYNGAPAAGMPGGKGTTLTPDTHGAGCVNSDTPGADA